MCIHLEGKEMNTCGAKPSACLIIAGNKPLHLSACLAVFLQHAGAGHRLQSSLLLHSTLHLASHYLCFQWSSSGIFITSFALSIVSPCVQSIPISSVYGKYSLYLKLVPMFWVYLSRILSVIIYLYLAQACAAGQLLLGRGWAVGDAHTASPCLTQMLGSKARHARCPAESLWLLIRLTTNEVMFQWTHGK